jgi:hypothetical protein
MYEFQDSEITSRLLLNTFNDINEISLPDIQAIYALKNVIF